MIRYIYIVSYMSTTHNVVAFATTQKLEDKTFLAFEDPLAAAEYAIAQHWWPFCIERIEVSC